MDCKFIKIDTANRPVTPHSSSRDEFGARAGCIVCGEIRIVWSNGEVMIEKYGRSEAHRKR